MIFGSSAQQKYIVALYRDAWQFGGIVEYYSSGRIGVGV
jgi:hypothetical protein